MPRLYRTPHYCRDLKRGDFDAFEAYWEEKLRKATEAGFSFEECAQDQLDDLEATLKKAQKKTTRTREEIAVVMRQIRERQSIRGRLNPTRTDAKARRTPQSKKTTTTTRVPLRRTFGRARRSSTAPIKRGWPPTDDSNGSDNDP